MPATRRRRIVEIIVAGLVFALLLPVSYVTGAVCISYAGGAGWITNLPGVVAAVYEPLEIYVREWCPGSNLILDACNWGRELGWRHWGSP